MERGDTWTDERLDERMSTIDQTFERLHEDLGGIRDELRGLRSDFSGLQDRLMQIGFGLVGVLIAAMVTVIVAIIA